MKLDIRMSKILLFVVFMLFSILSWGQNTYTLITSNSDLVAGGKYIIVGVNSGSYYALGNQANSNRPAKAITVASGSTTVTIATTSTDTTNPYELTLSGSTGAWNLYDAVNSTYLVPKTGANNGLVGQATTTNANWAISVAGTGVATMTCETTSVYARNILKYNTASTLMACYNGGQTDVYLYKLASSTPTITTNKTSLTGFTYLQGNGPSTSQTYTVSGSNLTNDITITPPANYEISTSAGSGYVSSPSTLTLTQSGGNVAVTTIYVRLKAGLLAGNYNSETITMSSAGATSISVTCSGTVTAPTPVLIVKRASGATIPTGSAASTGYDTVFAAQPIGDSLVKTYTLDNTTGTGALTVTSITSSSGDFSVGGVAFPLTINPGTSSTFTVTFSPLATGTRGATITIANNSATANYTFDVQGTGNCPSATNTLTPNSGPAGTEVTITATSGTLSGVTSVMFNGMAASSFTQVSATVVKAIVPVGATSGSVVTTNSYGCTASTVFSVITKDVSSCEGTGGGSGSGTPSDLFISQFTDSNTGSMSYIELYNGTASAITLTNYSLKFYSNGSTTVSNTLTLTGSVAAGASYVVAVGVKTSMPWNSCSGLNDQYNGTLAQQTSSGIGGINFLDTTTLDTTIGHDHVALYNGTTHIDSWGEYGNQSWATSLNLGGKGVNFSRKNTVTLPNTTYSNADWDINDWAACSDEDYSGIGAYSISNANPPSIITQPVVSDNCGNVSFTVVASEGFTGTGNTMGLAYQWYENAPGTNTWTALTNGGIYSGIDTATLVLTPADSKVGYQYYCQVRENGATCYLASHALMITNTPNPAINASISGNNGPVICTASDAAFTLTGTADAVVTYNINGGTNATATLTGGTSTITVAGATSNQTLNLVSVTNGTCTKTLSGTSTVSMGNNTTWKIVAPAITPTWDNGAPTASMTAVIEAAYSESADITACSLTVTNNAVATIPTGYDVFLSKGLTVDSGSTFNLSSDSNLVQNTGITNLNGGAGTVNIQRATVPLMRLDYVMWGSPVAGQQLQAFSPETLSNRFYTYSTSVNNYAATASTNTFADATGYLIRMPALHPYTATAWTGTFTGVPHSGDYSATLTNLSATQRFNAIANPYPSTISISSFVAANSSNITGTLYFWRKTNSTTVTPGYCTWAGGTFTGNGQPGATDIGGVLEVGQGFIVEASATGTQAVFNNAMRTGNNSSHLLKNTTIDYNRIWLNITSPANEFSQMAVGYITGATNDVDLFDGKQFSSGPISLNMKINDVPYVIQGKSLPFADTDVVPLSYKVTNAGNYTIAIDHVDGLFSNGTQDIFIKDNLNNTYTNLNNGSFTFASDAGTFDNRLELVYRSSALSNNNQVAKDIVVFKQNDQIVVEGGNVEISKVEVYDLRGRLVINKKDVNATSTRLQSVAQNQVLIVKVIAADNTIFTKKVMN